MQYYSKRQYYFKSIYIAQTFRIVLHSLITLVISVFFSFYHNHNVLTFSQQQILDPLNLKECADNNFKFDENGRKFSKRVENTVGKG